MQRTSERIRTHKKIDHSRKKSPSAIIKSSELMFLKPKPMHSYDSYMIGFHLAEDAIDNILQNVHQIITKIEEHKLYSIYRGYIERIRFLLQGSIIPNIEGEDENKSILQNEPEISILDHVCGNERFMETKKQRHYDSAVMPSSPNKETTDIQYRIKNSCSTKEICRFSKGSNYGFRRNTREGLVPLSFLQSEKDIPICRIQSMYREKRIKGDQAKQLDCIPKFMKAADRLKNGNTRQNEQFNFDYNGQKIPISVLTSLKKNQLNVLKTKYKIHKDRTEVKNHKKIQEKFSYTKLKEFNQTNQNLLQNSEVRLIKKGIEKTLNWQGKLASIKLITDANETPNDRD